MGTVKMISLQLVCLINLKIIGSVQQNHLVLVLQVFKF